MIFMQTISAIKKENWKIKVATLIVMIKTQNRVKVADGADVSNVYINVSFNKNFVIAGSRSRGEPVTPPATRAWVIVSGPSSATRGKLSTTVFYQKP